MMKRCSKCRKTKPARSFCRKTRAHDGLNPSCKACELARQRNRSTQVRQKIHERTRAWRIANFERVLLGFARRRARAIGVPFDLVLADIVIPERCPLLGIPMVRGCRNDRTRRSAPSLDRLRAALGYVKGNVWVISHRANMLKSNGTCEELELLAKNLRAKLDAG